MAKHEKTDTGHVTTTRTGGNSRTTDMVRTDTDRTGRVTGWTVGRSGQTDNYDR